MTLGARKEGLSRRHRFVGRGAFAAALRSPRKIRGTDLLLHVAAGAPGASRLGVSAPKRFARRAVVRNRLKRLAREAFRRHPVKEAGLDLVLALRGPLAEGGEQAWLAAVRGLLDRAGGR